MSCVQCARVEVACVLVLASLVAPASALFSISQNNILMGAGVEYHAYENAWTVHFENVGEVHFDALFVQVCQPAGNASEDAKCVEPLQTPYEITDCGGLFHLMQWSRFSHAYLDSLSNASSFEARVCNRIRTSSDELQLDLNTILLDAKDRRLVTLRQPLALHIAYEPDTLARFTTQGANHSMQVTFLLTQVIALQHTYTVHRRLLTIVLETPTQSLLTFNVKNPCSKRGYVVPPMASLVLKDVDGWPFCSWTCRVDHTRRPYNAIAPTAAQLNASSDAYAALPVKYECLPNPVDFVAVFFSFEIDTDMLVGTNLQQAFFDALDSMAMRVQLLLSTQHAEIHSLSLAVLNTVHHTESFEAALREAVFIRCALQSCASSWVPNEQGWTNEHFAHHRQGARRLLSTQTVTIDGMLQLQLLPVSTLLVSNEARHSLIGNLRSAIEHESVQLDSQVFNTVIQRFDVHRMLGFASDSTMRRMHSHGLFAESEELTSDALVHNAVVALVFVAVVAVGLTAGLLSRFRVNAAEASKTGKSRDALKGVRR